ncbi:MAG: hypothetical protein A2913_01150 [Parcubacteria group bacterium RIFCSPLOWO2_01_FULL_40_65]|nr:MAG: hypothetical protein A2734_00795 [Parcubacteria group bacterium RIFCSPHIGHO2_01_FULL_40_30]OHB19491.1 MAG: hypothetical protein A3D40_02515 [Parcubacteria group bacterium RIFCSPHIGHO2_02_FULL_40_12]OHB22094.1 MAG: hypothetical protein A2913_01150 [Parcubacteria group bacterium RIFCSPLOWO2_01_FULL_40_65]OHB23689.1 MAG: hypothetical protein A3I22_02550 [Parcubacteria group bacterium RIFCSPLOWO2_02_FULL_40_12]OHB24386.1 MAG: hypothetical protein A3F96_00740 [Parcubacteria group bacterium R
MKKIFWIILIVALAIVGYWFWQTQQSPDAELPQLPQVSNEDTTVQIQQDLNEINLGDIDAEFQSIDADLNNL